VRVTATGVCHTDLNAKHGNFVPDFPILLGHEAAGVIEEVGPGVTSVQPGDHVVVMWTPMCGRCYFCVRGQPYLCDANQILGLMDDGTSRLSRGGELLFHGINSATFAEAAILREYAVVKIPDDIPFDIAAVVGCGVLTGVGAAIHTANIKPGESVAMVGCGGVGINVIQGARLAGADPIIAIDTMASKLEMARSFGATHTIDGSQQDAPSQVLMLTEGRGVDAAFEVVGNAMLQKQMYDVTRRGGRCVFVGVAPLADQVSLPAALLTLQEKFVCGCYYGSCDPKRDIPRFLRLHQAGKLDLQGLVTQTLPLEDVNRAFEDMEAGKVIRTVLTP
jgi:Zn-dependent alcohol dehydrogenase